MIVSIDTTTIQQNFLLEDEENKDDGEEMDEDHLNSNIDLNESSTNKFNKSKVLK